MRHSRAFLAFALILISTISCSAGPLTGTDPASNGGGQVLFQDDFSDPSSGWATYREAQNIVDYDNGAFRIFVNQTNFDYWSVPDLRFTDVRIEVDITKQGGPDDNDFGIICRYKDGNNFYGFLISSDGYYGITRRENAVHEVIGMEGMKHSETVNIGAAKNHIRADCISNTLTLYVNGKKLAEVQDSSFAVGDVGLLAGSFDQPGVDILFDNFVVKKP